MKPLAALRFPRTAFLLVLTLVVFGCQPQDRKPSHGGIETLYGYPRGLIAAVDEPAPDFTFTTVTGERQRLSDLEGKVVLLNFWATWCAPCLAEIPDLMALQEEFGADDFVVLGVSVDNLPEEDIRAFAETFALNYPIVLDKGPISEAYGGAYSLPTTFVIDRSGQIRQRVIGIFPVETERANLEALLNAQPG